MAKKSTAAHAASHTPAPAKPKPDKSLKFRELATKRVNRTAHAIRLIGNLANRSSYEYTVDQAALILATLDEAVRHVESAFSKQTARSRDLVTF